jgi:tol-pal system protein YbgF
MGYSPIMPHLVYFAMKNIILVILSFMMFFYGCALQRDVMTLDNRQALIEKRYLESQKKNKDLEAQLKAQKQDNQNLRNKFAEQNASIESLRQEIQIIGGRLEETEYALKQKMQTSEESYEKKEIRLDRIDQTASSNKDRIARIERYLNFESTEPDVKAGQEAGIKTQNKVKQKLTEDGIYQAAKQAFDQGDLELARERFQKLIDTYPKSTMADNAQFWIGEIYYNEKWYEKAILEYQKVIENYPNGNKVQSSLLKQGFSFFNLGDKANARLIFTELIKKYPKSNEAEIAKKKLKALAH